MNRTHLVLALSLGTCPIHAATPDACDERLESRAWLAEHRPLLDEETAAEFAELEPDAAHHFVRGFWSAAGADTAFVERWYERVAAAESLYADLDDPRSRSILALGEPRWRILVSADEPGPTCGLFVPFEASLATSEGMPAYFVAYQSFDGSREWTIWDPDRGLGALFDPTLLATAATRPSRDERVRRAVALAKHDRPSRSDVETLLEFAESNDCFAGMRHVSALLAEALVRASSPREIHDRLVGLRDSLRPARPGSPSRDAIGSAWDEWTVLGARTTMLAPDESPPLVRTTVTVVRSGLPPGQATLPIFAPSAATDDSESHRLERDDYTSLLVRALWCRADGRSDGSSKDGGARTTGASFVRPNVAEAGEALPDRPRATQHVSFWVPLGTPAIELGLASRLPPGRYRLALRVTDSRSGSTTISLRDETLASVQTSAGAVASGAAALHEPDTLAPDALDALELSWTFDPVSRVVRANAGVFGSRIAAVRFVLGAKREVVATRAPFEASFDIDPNTPRQRLVAEGLDRAGSVVAEDHTEITPRPAGSSVRIIQPAPDASLAGGFWVQAAVAEAVGQAAESVEVWLDDRLLAILASPPWLHHLAGEVDPAPRLLRVVARFPNGQVAEDARLLGTKGYRDAVDVQVREHWLLVEDAGGAPVTDLRAAEIELFRDGERVERFRLLPGGEVPLSLALLVDSSTTMLPNQEEVLAGLDTAVESVLGARDRVMLLEFDGDLRTVVPFTDDQVWLREGIATLDSEGRTALYDAVAGAVPAFQGTAGRRALLVVTDGFDGDSRLSPQAAARAVRRAGLPVYVLRVIGPSLPLDAAFDPGREGSALATARNALEMLARGGSGNVLEVRNEASLREALSRIHLALGAQYLLLEEGRPSPDPGELTVRVRREGRYRGRILGASP